jgi:hypothetical protein
MHFTHALPGCDGEGVEHLYPWITMLMDGEKNPIEDRVIQEWGEARKQFIGNRFCEH